MDSTFFCSKNHLTSIPSYYLLHSFFIFNDYNKNRINFQVERSTVFDNC